MSPAVPRPTRCLGVTQRLQLVKVDVARELNRGQVDDAHRVARVDRVEAHAERVELTVVGEDLEGLLRVVRRVEQLDPGV